MLPLRSALPFPFSSKRKKQRSSGSFSAGLIAVMSAQRPRAPPLPASSVCASHRKTSAPLWLRAAWSLLAHPRRTSSLSTSPPTTPCHWQRLMQKSGEVLARSLKPFPLLNLWGRDRTPSSSRHRAQRHWRTWASSGRLRKSPPMAFWTSGTCREAVNSPLVNDPTRSCRQFMTSSPRCGTPPIRPGWIPRQQQLSPPLTTPPLEEAVAAHLCPPSALGLKAHVAPPSRPCRTTSVLANRAYAAASQAGSALTMAVLQVFQAKLLRRRLRGRGGVQFSPRPEHPQKLLTFILHPSEHLWAMEFRFKRVTPAGAVHTRNVLPLW